ncbi:MAG: DUF5103 domain-containing protein [Bacteroidales bacterium]|nr:DUF5103 domain-containing protein [Bacteroidales bacterium]
MRRLSLIVASLLLPLLAMAASRILNPQVKTLQAVVNGDWLSPTVMTLNSDDVLYIDFDELSHDYHRYAYTLERCEADWSTAEEVFESDWLEGFNGLIIDDYERSLNTTVPYTHYSLQIPNSQCRLKMSGNYRLHITDDDLREEIAVVEFMVAEQLMPLALEMTTNTDVDLNQSHQQLSMSLSYNHLSVTYPQEQIYTVVKQNDRDDNCRINVKPTFVNANGLDWTHCRQLIFDAGNEYRKFEILDPSHPTMGIDHISWDGDAYQAYPFIDEPRPNYLYDEDADGAFFIRNSDNREINTVCDYIWVNYRLKTPRLSEGHLSVSGHWTNESPETYRMTYDEASGLYTASILQKQGYYNYQYLWQTADGKTHNLPSEGNFYQTENRYQVYIYYKGTGERTWRLVGYRQLIFS